MNRLQTAPAPTPKRPFSAVSTTNPRRAHPSHSTSLPKHKRVKLDQSPNGSEEKRRSSIRPVSSILQQAESRDSGSDRSAVRWFASRNENVVDLQGKRAACEFDSPFYLAHQTSSYPQNFRAHDADVGTQARDDTENDELRGVIDDLTVQNKRLKSALRSWNTQSSPDNSNPDRVFEVRAHGLPAEKKRQLECLLWRFASQLGDSPTEQTAAGTLRKSDSSNRYTPEAVPKVKLDPTPADSGYASISHSGMNSSSQTSGNRHSGREPVSKRKKDTDIKNYLHDIPDSLLPKETVHVNENTKMQLVVQRLEHLFIDKTATPGEHSLPVQQQQISRSAAKADRQEDRRLNRTSKVEGLREAQILPPDTHVNLDAFEVGGQRLDNRSSSDLSSTAVGAMRSSDCPGSPDQRPTRPLDLDIHRAQVATENIDYIRHLGMSSPQFEDNPEFKDQPWMYLNLLVSMAQLHTLSVTPAFVRKAVKKLSTKFELSKDGHKIRWKGRTTSDGPWHPEAAESPLHRTSYDTGDDGGRPSARSTASTFNNRSVSMSDGNPSQLRSRLSNLANSTTAPTSAAQSKSGSAFEYKPVVFQGKRPLLKAQDSYLDSSSSFDDLSPESCDQREPRRPKVETNADFYEGYMTFFNNQHFFADLSGDKTYTVLASNGPTALQDVVGIRKEQQPAMDETIRDANACYYLTSVSPERTSWPDDCALMNMPVAPIKSAGEDETQPVDFDASGIGGVRPEDNFALNVQIARQRQKRSHGRTRKKTGDRPPAIYSYKVDGCTKLSLQPSRLPPPSYVFLTASSSSSTEDGDRDADEDSEESSEAEESPAPAVLLWQWSSSSDERQAGDDDDSVSSSSLGVLEAARARVPQAGPVNKASRPTSGSLAATAGASWSAASHVHDLGMGRDADEESVDSMSVEQDF